MLLWNTHWIGLFYFILKQVTLTLLEIGGATHVLKVIGEFAEIERHNIKIQGEKLYKTEIEWVIY